MQTCIPTFCLSGSRLEELYRKKSRDKTDWPALTEQMNVLHAKLQKKPRKIRLGHICNPGGILNAYREGDLSFDQAVKAMKDWAASKDK